ncbi:hypothetical protein BZG36_02506 [Bifiguratus adelaidae]|uniref:Inhibitor I9 domain-containing protein n=1 Tax=Bifiguratus adelaidae TaxID=1938954 RepID=A0A261Y2Q5_9FUNG|nr:hypothetical protein BZG36_02506 [Bifiguratus adelaidae]
MDKHAGYKDCIIMYKSSTPQDVVDTACDKIEAMGGHIKHIYKIGIKGIAARIPDDLVNAFDIDPWVNYVEPDGIATIQ